MKIRQHEEPALPMTFREKTAWISILSVGGIYGFYFWSIGHSGHGGGGFRASGLLATIVALAVVQTVLRITVAISSPKEARATLDERERLIELRAAKFAYDALAWSVAFACFFGAFEPPVIFNTNALLFILVMAEILRSGYQIIQFRRGA